MDKGAIRNLIENGGAALGIELGSTRIKAVLIDSDHAPIASGSHAWENRLENGVWTYRLEDVWKGVQDAYADLKRDVREQYGTVLKRPAAIGISAMMHGYIPLNAAGEALSEFRTWRNTITGEAAEKLTRAFQFNIPQRWSIAHLYQAMLNGEAHVKDIAHLFTLAGYLHWMLTGEKVIGVGEASGMFPIDSATMTYDAGKMAQFDAISAEMGYAWRLADLLPKVKLAGEWAGVLTAKGAKLLDPAGDLAEGIPMCPPEGDAGTGMVATNSVRPATGNVSAGTSVFAMAVLEKPLSKLHEELDMVTTPDGMPVAMVHCNNCSSEIDAWAGVLGGFLQASGQKVDMNDVYTALFDAALEGDCDCDGIVDCNYLSGEHITGLTEGRPMLVRMPSSRLTFANFARSLISGALVTLKLGMNILTIDEGVHLRAITGHGGLFKTGTSGQKLLAAALNTPITVMKTAGEGGPWGMALLAAYAVRREDGETLPDYLEKKVFHNAEGRTVAPEEADVTGFTAYADRFEKALGAERAAVDALK